MQIIIDFDGTLTEEEAQVDALIEKSLLSLANDLIGVPYTQIFQDYLRTKERITSSPHKYWWEVNGLVASYCNEGPFILHTTTLQVMLRDNVHYLKAIETHFPNAEYDPVADCTNHLFHKHTAALPPQFRPGVRETLTVLQRIPGFTPVILTNSLGDKVKRFLATLNLEKEIEILGDTRQYAMDGNWNQNFNHPQLGPIQVWPVDTDYQVDLRRPIYYQALMRALASDPHILVIADTFSLPGALPLLMGIPFILTRTSYTPEWCIQAVKNHPYGYVVDSFAAIKQLDIILPYLYS